MARLHDAHEQPDVFRLDGGGRLAVRCFRIVGTNGSVAVIVLHGRTDRGRGVVVVQRVDDPHEPRPIACRAMDNDEAASYDAWLGARLNDHDPAARRGTSRDADPQWPARGIAPTFDDESEEAAFWLSWSFADAMNELGEMLHTTSPERNGREAA